MLKTVNSHHSTVSNSKSILLVLDIDDTIVHSHTEGIQIVGGSISIWINFLSSLKAKCHHENLELNVILCTAKTKPDITFPLLAYELRQFLGTSIMYSKNDSKIINFSWCYHHYLESDGTLESYPYGVMLPFNKENIKNVDGITFTPNMCYSLEGTFAGNNNISIHLCPMRAKVAVSLAVSSKIGADHIILLDDYAYQHANWYQADENVNKIMEYVTMEESHYEIAFQRIYDLIDKFSNKSVSPIPSSKPCTVSNNENNGKGVYSFVSRFFSKCVDNEEDKDAVELAELVCTTTPHILG